MLTFYPSPIPGSKSHPIPDPDPQLWNNGFGSGRPKNMQIRIPNIDVYSIKVK
jgi:hypothetical protein